MSSEIPAIRRYRASDQDAVRELHRLGLDQFGVRLEDASRDEDLTDVLGHYVADGGEFLVGVSGDRIVCMGGLRRRSDNLAELKRLRVHPDHQRRGLGQLLLQKLEEKAVLMGYREVCLDTTTRQIPARSLFEKNGYREVRRRRTGGLEIVFYMKELGV